jgi:hypothetical protein
LEDGEMLAVGLDAAGRDKAAVHGLELLVLVYQAEHDRTRRPQVDVGGRRPEPGGSAG